jgi:hypothetical protein
MTGWWQRRCLQSLDRLEFDNENPFDEEIEAMLADGSPAILHGHDLLAFIANTTQFQFNAERRLVNGL